MARSASELIAFSVVTFASKTFGLTLRAAFLSFAFALGFSTILAFLGLTFLAFAFSFAFGLSPIFTMIVITGYRLRDRAVALVMVGGAASCAAPL